MMDGARQLVHLMISCCIVLELTVKASLEPIGTVSFEENILTSELKNNGSNTSTDTGNKIKEGNTEPNQENNHYTVVLIVGGVCVGFMIILIIALLAWTRARKTRDLENDLPNLSLESRNPPFGQTLWGQEDPPSPDTVRIDEVKMYEDNDTWSSKSDPSSKSIDSTDTQYGGIHLLSPVVLIPDFEMKSDNQSISMTNNSSSQTELNPQQEYSTPPSAVLYRTPPSESESVTQTEEPSFSSQSE